MSSIIENLKGVLPRWLVITISIISLGVGSYLTLSKEDIDKLLKLLQPEQQFNLTLPEQELNNILYNVEAIQIGIWSNNYTVPVSATLTAETRRPNTNYPNINRMNILHADTREQSFAHWRGICYSGIPELVELQMTGINYIVSCPIVIGDPLGQPVLGGFIQAEFQDKPNNDFKVIEKLSKYSKSYKFQ